MPATALITGFPGFIAGRLVRDLRRESGARILALALPAMREAAERMARKIEAEDGRGAIELVSGDITAPDLALEPERARALVSEVTQVFHLAALYDLAVPQTVAERVNVAGTRHVLDFCESLERLERLVYFSTCYVAGKRPGTILESDLEAGQVFRNHYESTKYAAEVEVRRRMAQVPTVIVRPSVVVGDSRTGETAKYDGPYFMLAGFARLEQRGFRWLANFYPDYGSGRGPFHAVPVDYITRATAALASDPRAIGRTFQLADPEPLCTRDFTRAIFREFGLSGPWLRFPVWVGRLTLSLPGVAWLAGVPRQVMEYYGAHQLFDTAGARELLVPRGVVCPKASEYLPTLVAYVRAHPDGPLVVS